MCATFARQRTLTFSGLVASTDLLTTCHRASLSRAPTISPFPSLPPSLSPPLSSSLYLPSPLLCPSLTHRALTTEAKVESGTSQSKSGTSVNLNYGGIRHRQEEQKARDRIARHALSLASLSPPPLPLSLSPSLTHRAHILPLLHVKAKVEPLLS